MSVSVPVFLVNKSGGACTDNVNCSPCISLAVVSAGMASRCVAMLDSGATGIYADPAIARKLDLPVIKTDTVYAVGATHASNVYAATFWIDDLPDLSVEVQEVPLRSQGQPYDIVLGRSFLTMFDFGFDLRKRAWKLEAIGVAKASNLNRTSI